MGAGSAVKGSWAEVKESSVEIWQYARNKNWRTMFQKKYWWRWLLVVLFIAGAVVLSHYHNKIVSAFKPHQGQITSLPVSWLIPTAILIIISFPPLFGHELVLLIVGLIWGLWIGFGIAAAGTFIGEFLCYFAFKYLFTKKAKKIEEGSIMYACLARLMRDSGLWVVTLVRFSVLPGHIVTAIQSTVGMSIWIYSIAVIVSLPKQLVVVYLGVLFGTSTATGASPDDVRKERIISLSVFFLTTVMTIIAGFVVYIKARRVYPEILAEKKAREAGQIETEATLEGDGRAPGYQLSSSAIPGGQYGSTSDIPLRDDPHMPGYGGQAYGGQPYGGQAYGGQTYGSSRDNMRATDPFEEAENPGMWHPHSQTMPGLQPSFSPVPTSDHDPIASRYGGGGRM